MTTDRETGALLDELMANAWPPSEVVRDGGWRFRWTSGITRRANSVLAVAGEDRIAELVAAGEAFYRHRDARPRFQVSTASAPAGLAGYLTGRGYEADARTYVMGAALDHLPDRGADGPFTATTTSAPTDAWFDTYWFEAGQGRSIDAARTCRDVLLAPALPARYVSVADNGETIAVGQIVLERGWGGVQCMTTAPGHRRRGAAALVLEHLHRAATQAGVQHLYLAVMADNPGARSLYERAGYVVSHEYCYYSPG